MDKQNSVNRSTKTLIEAMELIYKARRSAFREKNYEAWGRADRTIMLLQRFEIERWMERHRQNPESPTKDY
ncbi:MAG: hypothetical protein V4555_16280 [Acidobacteriota bacterium]